MSQAQQPEALRLADALAYCDSSVAAQAARELRTQHARIAELEQPQAAQAAVPDGWKLTPRKATFEMAKAGGRAAREYMEKTGGNSTFVIYEAMLAVAPVHPPAGVPAPDVVLLTRELSEMLDRSANGLEAYRDTANWTDADEDHLRECRVLVVRADEALAATPAAPALEVTDAMAMAFHHAITDGSIGADDLEEIKTGLRAVLANVCTTPAAGVPFNQWWTEGGHHLVAEKALCDGWRGAAEAGFAGGLAQAAGVPAAAPDARDAAFEAVRKRLCGLHRYSFVLDDDGVVRRVQDQTGNWIEFDDAHELFDPVSVDAAIAAQAGKERP